MKTRWTFAPFLLAAAALARADGPGDNLPDNVRPVPPPGVAIPDADRTELQNGAAALGKEIDALRTALKDKPVLLDLLPDVQVYHNAVRYALAYNEFFGNARTPAEAERAARSQVAIARNQLKQGKERAAQLREGKPAWTTQTGLVVRGYVSKIDGSVQPYGLFVPPTYKPDYPHKYRLDFWCHGRGETLSELNFIEGCQKSPGPFTPPNAFVVQLYGRYCCANKLAGEVDLFEALENVKKHYPIDEDRLVVRGFSMGGAAVWHFAVHYPSVFAAAAPGAGFSETPDFLKVFQRETIKPTDYEQALWHVYDCNDYAVNLFNLPTVAYSGEIDSQKQAADVMAAALKKEGMELTHVIGPKTAHAYEPNAKKEVSRRIDSIVERGRNPVPEEVKFTTWTLRYNNSFWVTLDGIERHWQQARIDARLAHRQTGADVTVGVHGVTAFTLSMAPGECPLDNVRKPRVRVYELGARQRPGDPLEGLDAAPVQTDRSWVAHFRKVDGKWQAVDSADDGTLAKRHGLQGPIDDAFLDSFLMVRPTGKPLNDKVGGWADKEMAHAIDHWRKQFRGEARVKSDDAVTDADVKEHNLVLWGDPQSNKVLAKIADKLPIRWGSQGVQLGEKTFDVGHHVPLLVYPNPLNPQRYVVLNSGFTFREYDYLNNARQVPKLPDYAVIDVNVPVSSRLPGGVVAAGFFDERWKLPAK
ncbi:MAG TPA: prolyl oligopeptidase family serine peptidase [Gemmataceae bacterium]|nr:prolyl oligopeptidase family serine peptidase [Gemmataceae bacterium]